MNPRGNPPPLLREERPSLARDWRSRDGVANLIELARATARATTAPLTTGLAAGGRHENLAPDRVGQRRVGRPDRHRDPAIALRLAPRQEAPGALNARYHIPRVAFRRRP